MSFPFTHTLKYIKNNLTNMPKCRNCMEEFVPEESSFCSRQCADNHSDRLFLH